MAMSSAGPRSISCQSLPNHSAAALCGRSPPFLSKLAANGGLVLDRRAATRAQPWRSMKERCRELEHNLHSNRQVLEANRNFIDHVMVLKDPPAGSAATGTACAAASRALEEVETAEGGGSGPEGLRSSTSPPRWQSLLAESPDGPRGMLTVWCSSAVVGPAAVGRSASRAALAVGMQGLRDRQCK